MATKVNADIQSLRGLAIILVLVQHFANRLPTAQWYHEIFRHFAFWGGVDLFFVISGYVIVRSLLDDGSIDARGRISWARFSMFWQRRFFRLLPASWLWLAVAVSSAGFLTATQSHETAALENTVFYTVLGLANYHWSVCVTSGFPSISCTNADIASPQWSLALEEQFYAVLSLALLIVGLRRFVYLGIGLLAAYTLYYGLRTDDIGFFSLPWVFRPHGMVAGALLAMTFNGRQVSWKLPISVRKALLAALLVALCTAPVLLPLKWAIPILAAISSIMVSLALPDGSISGGRFRVLEWIGERSYSLYLCHMPIFLFLREYMARMFGPEILAADDAVLCMVCFTAAIGLALIVADISYRLVETPFRRWGRRNGNHDTLAPQRTPDQS
jgi:peptidoglycan/LPS O-acetylase OafA/YrhL